jgi:putative transposase
MGVPSGLGMLIIVIDATRGSSTHTEFRGNLCPAKSPDNEQKAYQHEKPTKPEEWNTRAFVFEIDHASSLTHPRQTTRGNLLGFSTVFDEALRRKHVTVKKTQFRSPNMNAFSERFVQSIKQECLDHFVVFGAQHMDVLCREYLEYYHTERPHQGRENELLVGKVPQQGKLLKLSDIKCTTRLGGLLKSYQRKAG